MKKYPNYTLQEKIDVIKNCPIENAPDYYLRLTYGFDRKDIESEQLRSLLLQNTDTLQNVVKETILELNRVSPKSGEQISFEDIKLSHAKKVITNKKR